jgi:hypothetical protein
MYGALNYDFFTLGVFTNCPNSHRLNFFISFLEKFLNDLHTYGYSDAAKDISPIVDKFKAAAHYKPFPDSFLALPDHMKPNPAKVPALELIRNRFGLDQDTFLIAVGNSKWAVIQAQRATL